MNAVKKQIILVGIFILFFVTTVFTQAVQGKSVYAIINHGWYTWPPKIASYLIQGNQIEHQITMECSTYGPCDLAIDSTSGYLFVTYEESNIIEIVNAKNMTLEGSAIVSGVSSHGLSGIVFDEARQKIYVVDRESVYLFVYSWNPATKTLTPDGTNPKTLSELGGWGAYGVALDRVNGHLYVTNYTSIIHYYDTDYWSHVDYVDVGQIAVDVEIDSGRGYLYAGGYRSGHTFLVKFNLSTGRPESDDIEAQVTGIGVDPDTGLVYTTIYGYNELRVYDTSNHPFTSTDSEFDSITGPAGVCVPIGDVGYKPDRLYLSKSDSVADGDCVSVGQEFTYTIDYGGNNIGDTSVVITDTLPPEVLTPTRCQDQILLYIWCKL
jgi:DNA-binding beta-propeller fold protein YncE